MAIDIAKLEQSRMLPGQKFTPVFREILEHLRKDPTDLEDIAQFFAFAASRAKAAKGQLFQDLWALWESGNRSGGYFVEFGGGDGVHLSNSFYLEKSCGWSGIVAEPNPESLVAIQKARSCYISNKAVFTRSNERVSFLTASSPELSRLEDIVPQDNHEKLGVRRTVDRIEVETITLADLLEEAKAPFDIDYMSVDTEGSELAILSSFDFSTRNIRCITVEHNGTPQRAEIHQLLTSKGYRRKWEDMTWFDDWYVRG